MRRSNFAVKAKTVLGLVDGEELGVIPSHEHLLIDLSVVYVEPSGSSDRAIAHKPVSLETLHWLRYHV